MLRKSMIESDNENLLKVLHMLLVNIDKFTLACMLVLDSLGLITHTMPVLALGQTPNHMGSYRNPITIVNDYTS